MEADRQDIETPPWVHEAAALPIAFAQVREDALLDHWVVQSLGEQVRVIMIASGGCTAAALAASPQVASLHFVDPNPAQLALTRLKLRLLQTASGPERAAILGHTAMEVKKRKTRLGDELKALDLHSDSLGPCDFVAEVGPDYAGRYERVFAQLREDLAPQALELEAVLHMRDPAQQARRAAPSTALGSALDESFDKVLALKSLVSLFGEGATKNPVEPFSRHFMRRTREALATLPAAENTFLWQMLAGRFPPGVVSPWLAEPIPPRFPVLTWTAGFMNEALARAKPGEFDFVHLSNILDWLTPAEARATLDQAWMALRPGGYVLIRQLNSTLAIQALAPQFDWEETTAEAWHAQDRSFFYRRLHLGRKQ
jgi:S-adenosylmethionine-diacylglycerol 3-amino-3-carboxypropyl transferase